MKTLKLKSLIVAGLVTIGVSTSGNMVIGPGDALVSPDGRFEKENSDISQDIANISSDHDRILFLKEKYKKEKSSDREISRIATKKELKKAKADLRRDKAYLAADKCDLIKDRRAAMRDRRESISRCRTRLNDSRARLDKALDKGNEAEAQEMAVLVVQRQNELKNAESALERERKSKSDNLEAINREIKRADVRSDRIAKARTEEKSGQVTASSRVSSK